MSTSEDDFNRSKFIGRIAASKAAPYDYGVDAPIKAALDRAVEAAADAIERDLGISVRTLPAGTEILPYSYLLAARAQVFMWHLADRRGKSCGARNKRRPKFFQSIRMSYQIATGTRGSVSRKTISVDDIDDVKFTVVVGGEFFRFAKICMTHLLPPDMRPQTDGALSKIIERLPKTRDPETNKIIKACPPMRKRRTAETTKS